MAQGLRQLSEHPTDSRQKDLVCWSLVAAGALLIALGAPLLTGRIYTCDDLGAFHLPVRQFYAEQLERGEPFDWMPQLFAGFYLTGEGQAGTYHPLHLLLYRCLPLQAAMGCELLASYPFLFAGSWLLLRRWLRTAAGRGVGRMRSDRRTRAPSPSAAAALGALLATFSGFNLLHFIHPNAVAVVAHIPWLLWTIDVVLKDSSPRKVTLAQAGIAVLTGSQLLLGYPQYVWFSLLTEAAYTAFVLGTASLGRKPGDVTLHGEHGPRADARGSPTRLPRIAIAKLVGVLLGGVQLLPTLDALMHSTRQTADASFACSGSLNPLNLIQLVAPYLLADRVLGGNTHEMGLYAGAVPLVLIAWLATRWQRLGRLRPLAWATAAFGATALLLAFGGYAPLYRLQTWLPLVGRFRLPCRYIALVHLAVAVLAAMAFAVLLRPRRTQSYCVENGRSKTASHDATTMPSLWMEYRSLWGLLGATVLVAAGGILLRHETPIAAWPAVLAGPLLIAAAAALVVCAARGARWAPIGLILLTAADLGCYGWSYSVGRHTAFLDRYVASTIHPPGGIDRVWATPPRAEQEGQRAGNQLTLAGWRRADGYAGLEPQRRLDYSSLAALRAADVRWFRGDDRWREVTDPLPRVRLVAQAVASDDPARDIGRIDLDNAALIDNAHHVGPSIAPSRKGRSETPSYEKASPRSPASAAPTDTPTVLADRPGRIDLQAACDAPQLLVVAESYHSGWRATVDGRPQAVLRVNGDFLGCLLEGGEHRVEFEFRPRSLELGKLDSLLGLGFVSLMLIGGLRSGRSIACSAGILPALAAGTAALQPGVPPAQAAGTAAPQREEQPS